MQPWLYALLFIVLMMGIALVVDRHGYRLRRAAVRGSAPAPAARSTAFARQLGGRQPGRPQSRQPQSRQPQSRQPQSRQPQSRRPQPHGHGGSAGGL